MKRYSNPAAIRGKIASIFSLGALLASGVTMAQLEPLPQDRVRAFYVEPLTHRAPGDHGWISVRLCTADPAACEKEVTRIPIHEIKVNGTLRASFGEKETLNLKIKKDKGEATVATLKLKDGWLEPAELCAGNDTAADCTYTVLRDTEKQTLVLRIGEKRD